MKSRFLPIALLPVLIPAASHSQMGSPRRPAAARPTSKPSSKIENPMGDGVEPSRYRRDGSPFRAGRGCRQLAGQWFQGRAAFAKSLEGLHSAKTKESVWHTEQIQTSFLTPEIAIVHVYFSSSGERNPDGSPMPPRRGIFTRVEAKRDGRWVIVASQVTKIVRPETVDHREGARGPAGSRGRALRP